LIQFLTGRKTGRKTGIKTGIETGVKGLFMLREILHAFS